MVTYVDARDHQKVAGQVVSLAMRDLVEVWRTFTFDDAARAQQEIRAVLPLLIDGYGTPMAALSADWYDELRDRAKVSGRYTAQPGYGPGVQRLDSLAGYTANALYGANPDSNLALSRLSGGLTRILLDIDRDTIAGNSFLDPSDVRYARHASANACAFCALLATRGAEYATEEAALRIVGRGTDLSTNVGRRRGRRAQGIRARGSRQLGEKYHDDCRCAAVPVFGNQDYEEAPYVAKFREAYANAPVGGGANPNAIDLKTTLAAMRKELGSH